MVLPGISPVSSRFGTIPFGMFNSSGESCPSGAATTSCWVPSHETANSDSFADRSRNTSKSVRASHGGLIAALNECR